MHGKPYDPLPIGVLVLDGQMRIRTWNRWLAEHTGIPDTRAISQRLEDLFPGFRNPRFQMAVEQVLRNGGPQILSQALHRYLIPIDLPHLARHGFGLMRQHVHIEAYSRGDERLALVSVIDVTGSVLRTEALTDVAQRLEHDVNHDPLTGLFNRRFMWEWLDHQQRQAQRHHYPIAAMMLDVDHFKEINDRHGHPIGDRVLQDLARQLTIWVRESDVVVRYGGEEFLILLPCCDQTLSQEVAERIVRQTRQSCLGSLPIGAITCSIGVALFDTDHPLPPADLLNLADRRLYLAKQAGRDRVVTSG
ncbi:MAG: diguanylate cyclase [Pseudomonadota bacterium]|nr:diguanylate cyclase [Pseudomonadota bacterium]MDP1904555.1 diguanylate cyclase [Pseudomonadota bacterium]MDP2353246.1 diguanylate cyclase [Pseudomonadota bacterium]